MILVCGGLADGVTELVCSRLQDCGYPYRLLDLARFPEHYRELVTEKEAKAWFAITPDAANPFVISSPTGTKFFRVLQ